MASFCLDHFIETSDIYLESSAAELKAEKNPSHWICYIFQQIAELGYSERTKHYDIDTVK